MQADFIEFIGVMTIIITLQVLVVLLLLAVSMQLCRLLILLTENLQLIVSRIQQTWLTCLSRILHVLLLRLHSMAEQSSILLMATEAIYGK